MNDPLPLDMCLSALGDVEHFTSNAVKALTDGRRDDLLAATLTAGPDLERAAGELHAAITWWAITAVQAGATWREIGDALGITRQAAQQRFGSFLQEKPIPGL